MKIKIPMGIWESRFFEFCTKVISGCILSKNLRFLQLFLACFLKGNGIHVDIYRKIFKFSEL